MSDPLSVAASVIAVAQLGCAVAKGLYQIADEIGMAGLEVRLHAQEVDGFSKLLVRLQHTIHDLNLKSRRHEIDEIRSHIGEVLGICQKTLQPMKDEIDRSLRPLLLRFRDSPAKFGQVAVRIRWCFVSKGKIMFWREFLQAQHRMLDTTLLQAIYLSTAATGSTETTTILRDSLENSYTSLRNPVVRVGSVQGKLLPAPPTSSTPGVSSSPETEASQGNRVEGWSTHQICEGDHPSNDEMSLALLKAPASMPEPDLFGMTDEEIRAIKAATNLEIDGPTSHHMTQILLETDAAEKRTLEMVTTTLHGDKKIPNRDVRATRNHISSSMAWDLCGPDQIGGWSASRRRVFRASKMRFEVECEAPVIFFCPPNNTRGPVPGNEILFVMGTRESEVATRLKSADEAREADSRTWSKPRITKRSRVRALGRKKAGWFILLEQFQNMERSTREWEESKLKEEVGRTNLSRQSQMPTQVTRWESRSHVVALQAHKQRWDALPANSMRLYATTTFWGLIDMAAILGLYWKVFDQARSIYFAEGNGYSLSGHREPGFGVVVEFSLSGSNKFQDRRLIPTNDIRFMACGYVKVCTDSASPDSQESHSKQHDAREMIYMGGRGSVPDILASLGCETGLLAAMSGQDDQQSHLFPVAFEIIGMIAKIPYLSDSYLRRLPNPTPFIWNKQTFSVRVLVLEFQRYLSESRSITETPHILALREWTDEVGLAMADMILPGPYQDTPSCIPLGTLSVLKHAIERCDRYFRSKSPKLRNVVLRLHFNEVLRILSESKSLRTDSANRNFDDKNAHTDANTYERLVSAGPETREAVLMDIYFSTILPRVAKGLGPIFENISSFENSITRSVSDQGNEELAADGWCTLVLRMLCWLLLHDFDKEDVQIADLSKVNVNRAPVYIY